MNKKILAIIVLTLLVVGSGVFLLTHRKTKAPVLVSRTDPPKIRFEETTHDLGNVTEGVEIPYVFKIHNVGGEPLIINNVHTSCGCTLLNLKDKVIEPGKTGDLEVVIDTAMKQGFIRKTIDIRSNDPNHPHSEVSLTLNVLPNPSRAASQAKQSKPATATTASTTEVLTLTDPHAGLTRATRAKIFTGNCATCHVNQGKGKLGGDLYQADCAMCHGQNAEGAVGPALVPGNYHDRQYMAHILKTIRYGSTRHLSMPGFLREAGGPLTDGEIQSIVQYLQNKSEQAKGQTSQIPGG